MSMLSLAELEKCYRETLSASSPEQFSKGALDFLVAYKRTAASDGSLLRKATLPAHHAVLEYVITRSADNESTRKEIGQYHAASLASLLLSDARQSMSSALHCLQVLLYYYSPACRSLLSRLDQCALRNFSNDSVDARRNAAVLHAQCICLSKEAVECKVKSLLRTAHDAVATLCPSHDVDKCRHLNGSLSISQGAVDLPMGTEKLTILRVLQASLEGVQQVYQLGLRTTVAVPVIDIVALFECFTLYLPRVDVEQGVEMNASKEAFESLFEMLNVVIKCLRQLFSPYCSRVCNALVKMTKQNGKATPLSFKMSIRSLVYHTLATMLKHVGAASSVQLKFKNLLSIIQEEMSACALLVRACSDAKATDLCPWALDANRYALTSFFQAIIALIANVGNLLPAEAYQMLQLFAIRTMPRCQAASRVSSGKLSCGILMDMNQSLSRLLGAFIMRPHPRAPYYLNACIGLFRVSCSVGGDPEACRYNLALCERICNPLVPCEKSTVHLEAIEALGKDRTTEVQVLIDGLGENCNIGKRKRRSESDVGALPSVDQGKRQKPDSHPTDPLDVVDCADDCLSIGSDQSTLSPNSDDDGSARSASISNEVFCVNHRASEEDANSACSHDTWEEIRLSK